MGNVDERAWEATKVEPGVFLITGVGVERFTHMTNFDSWEAAERFQRMLDRSGISAELRRLGVQEGDTIRIANKELTWGDQQDDEGGFIVPEVEDESEEFPDTDEGEVETEFVEEFELDPEPRSRR
jgi:Obg family GTPase CgtA-like protein